MSVGQKTQNIKFVRMSSFGRLSVFQACKTFSKTENHLISLARTCCWEFLQRAFRTAAEILSTISSSLEEAMLEIKSCRSLWEMSGKKGQVTSHPKSPRTTGNEAAMWSLVMTKLGK